MPTCGLEAFPIVIWTPNSWRRSGTALTEQNFTRGAGRCYSPSAASNVAPASQPTSFHSNATEKSFGQQWRAATTQRARLQGNAPPFGARLGGDMDNLGIRPGGLCQLPAGPRRPRSEEPQRCAAGP